MTGNRVPTEQAVTRAHDFATALAEAGHTVTATLAYGVDSTAHQATAETGTASLAVLPRGLDNAHPHTHAPLLRSTVDNGGAAVSLCRPGTTASGATLKASAVVLAALARAVVLVEALDHVSAMYAAETAVDLHRPLLAAPATGDVRSSGNARLIDGQLAVNSPDPRLALALPHARVARAGDVADGDLLLAAVGEEGADYFVTPYIAHPEPFAPSCGCGVCCPVTVARRGGGAVSGRPLGVLRSVARRRPPAHRLRPAADRPAPRGVSAAMSPTTYTPSLPGISAADDDLDTIINWGAGADSRPTSPRCSNNSTSPTTSEKPSKEIAKQSPHSPNVSQTPLLQQAPLPGNWGLPTASSLSPRS